MKNFRQLIWTLVLGLIVIGTWVFPLETIATEQVEAGLQRALVSFATARAINAGIAVVQGTQVAVEPAGIGMQFSVGQALKPLNDIVEQFAHLMLAASVAFGIERVLIMIGAHWLVSLIIVVIAGAGVFCAFRHKPLPQLATKLLAVLVIIRFAMPVAIIGSDGMFQYFMAHDYSSSQKNIEAISGSLSSIRSLPQQATEASSAWEKIKGWSSQQLNVSGQLAALKEAAEKAIEHAVKLMAIFLLQTLVLPVLFVWLLWSAVQSAFRALSAWAASPLIR